MTKRSVPISLAFSVLPIALVAAASAWLADAKGDWYLSLQKPAFTPPDWAFPIAWGIVYVCAMLSIYLLLRSGAADDPLLIGILCLVGALNIGWTAVFFRLHAMIPALILLSVLLCALLYILLALYPVKRASCWLFLPHFLWAAFALALNVAFAVQNGAF